MEFPKHSPKVNQPNYFTTTHALTRMVEKLVVQMQIVLGRINSCHYNTSELVQLAVEWLVLVQQIEHR